MDIRADLEKLQLPIENAIAEFKQQADVGRLLQALRGIVLAFIEQLAVAVIGELLRDHRFLTRLKALAAKSGLCFKGFKPTSIRLLTGKAFTLDSPYFARAAPRGRKPKKRKPKSGCHSGLAYMGFFGRCSNLLASAAVQAALLCPSLKIAAEMLRCLGIEMDPKTIRRLCDTMGHQAMGRRRWISLSDADGVANRILFICMDGGRLRERRAKRGRRPAGHSRPGYHADWREPTQIVIEWLDTEGNKCPDCPPLYDATMADVDGAFQLLEDYLRQIEASKADLVVFCADGARRYWKRFGALARRLGIGTHFEIIDYTHAKQNLQPIINRLPKKLGKEKINGIAKEWKNLLWQGQLEEIYHQIRQLIPSPGRRKEALKKFENYFLRNFRRMQYAAFRYLNLPTGSGCVESAIRRVINLRLKSPGIFWKRESAEVFLFLRSTLLCGRWQTMLHNLLLLNRGQLEGCH